MKKMLQGILAAAIGIVMEKAWEKITKIPGVMTD